MYNSNQMTQISTDATALPEHFMEDLYDLLMCSIEPELMSAIIPQLDTLYTEEKKSQKKKRLQRYLKAFETFNQRFDAVFASWKEQLMERRNKALNIYKTQEKNREDEQIKNLEHSFDL